VLHPSPDTAPHRLMPDMRGFLSNPRVRLAWALYICARALFLTLAQALFVEDGVRSIRQSVQNGQFLCRLAQMRPLRDDSTPAVGASGRGFPSPCDRRRRDLLPRRFLSRRGQVNRLSDLFVTTAGSLALISARAGQPAVSCS